MKIHQACGTPNEDDANYCIGCGGKFEDAAPSFGYTPNVSELPMDGTWSQAADARSPEAAWGKTRPDSVMRSPWDQPAQDDPTQPVFGRRQASPWDGAPAGQPAQPQAEARPEAQQLPGDAASSGQLDAMNEALAGLTASQQEASSLMQQLGERLSSVEERLGGLSELFDGKIARNEHEIATMKRMSEEVQEYRDGLYEKLTLPLIRDLVDARDALGSICDRYAQSPEAADVIAEVEVCRSMLADRLARQSVEVVASSPGDEFLSFKHKIVGKVGTDDPDLQGRLAEVSGDSYRLGESYISPALVKVYALE